MSWPASTFGYELERDKLRQVRRRESRYLLRSNMRAASPELVWENYLLLTRIEQAFKDLKGDLAVRPIYHRTDARIEAHIFVSFLGTVYTRRCGTWPAVMPAGQRCGRSWRSLLGSR